MQNNDLQHGVIGALIGATMMFGGVQVSNKDVDPKTGATYEEIVSAPERDVYYNFVIQDLNQDYFRTSHQTLESARRSNDGTHIILKFDIAEIPRDKEFPEPMNHEEVIDFLNDCVNDYCIIEE